MPRIISQLSDKALGNLGELFGYLVNYASPISIPSPGELFSAYVANTANFDRLLAFLRPHGIDGFMDPAGIPRVGGPANYGGPNSMWQRILSASAEWFSADDIKQLVHRKIIPEKEAASYLRCIGWIDTQAVGQWHQLIYNVPSNVEAGILFNRGLVTEEDYKDMILANGTDPRLRDQVASLAKELPGPSDLVSFAVRDVWDAKALTTFGYNEEYPVEAEKWLSKQGLVYQTDNPVWTDAGLPEFNWMRAYWCAHWQLPSPQQGISMLQRLRPSLKDPTVPRDPSGETFSFDELKLLIKTADYPPYWRGKLAAIGYNPIGIRFLRALWSSGLIDPIGATELFLDQGYNLRDAQLQTNLLTKQYGATQLASCRKTSARTVLKAYQIGVVSRDQAAVQMFPLLQERQDQIDRFNALPADLQIAAATTSGLVQCLLSNQDLTYSVSRIAHKIQMIKHAYLKGAIAKLDARARLNALGIDATKLNDYLDDWELELLVPKKEETTGQILRWYGIGLLDGDQAEQRLAHLGYPADVIDTMLTEASLKSIAGRIRAVQASAKHVQGEIKVAEAAAKSAAQARKEAQATLRTSASLGKLVSWLKEGLISPPVFVRRAILIGVAPADAQIYAQEVADALAKQTAKAVAQATQKAQRTRPGHKQPSAAQLVKWAKKGLITRKTAASRLFDLGYSAADAEDLLAAGGV